jgi:lactoylglutathione lyase
MDVRFELFVDDASRSVAFYRDVLGFVEQQGYGNYHPMKRGSVVIGIGEQRDLAGHHYFQPDIQGSRKGLGVEIVLDVQDVAAEYECIQKAGYAIDEQLKAQEWGLTDFRLVDPDGYYLRITSGASG